MDYLIWYLVPLAIFFIPGALIYLLKWRQHRIIISFKGRLLSECNAARGRRMVGPLGRVKLLDRVAAGHSKSMARRRRCDHLGSEKRARIIGQKTGLEYVGENCYMFPGRKYTTRVAKQLVRGWLRSPGHRRNLLNPGFGRTGIGIVVRKQHVYATQMFTE